MAAINMVAVLERVDTVILAHPDVVAAGLQSADLGVPESGGTRVFAYVALGGQTLTQETTNELQRNGRLFVGLAYAVEGAEADAERTIAAIVDALIPVLLEERATGMGGLVDSVDWDFGLGDSPEYSFFAASEHRIYPVLLTVTQRITFG